MHGRGHRASAVLLGAIGPALHSRRSATGNVRPGRHSRRGCRGRVPAPLPKAGPLRHGRATRPLLGPGARGRGGNLRPGRPELLHARQLFRDCLLNAELGLSAVALTPILISGGIDLSVGAVMGLAAVCFGAARRDLQLPIAAAVAVALAIGCAGGALNAPVDFACCRRSSSRLAPSRFSRRRGRHYRSGP